MMRRLTLAAGILVLGAAPLRAEKSAPDFRADFEQVFRKGRSFAVVVQAGVPTTSIYGVDGKNSGTAHFSIDVVDGKWKVSEGILDFDQTAADTLNLGEVMELDSISYKDNRVDLRMVSVEAHKVTRGNWLLKSRKPEPVATNFKFFFPFRAFNATDVPRAVEYVGRYLKAFPSQDEARVFAARMLAGTAETARAHDTASAPARVSATSGSSTGAAASAPASKKEIKTGMTALEVIDILGKPQKEVTFENKSRWTYPDLTVVFENGRVKEVRF
jgi:hypothetical protein